MQKYPNPKQKLDTVKTLEQDQSKIAGRQYTGIILAGGKGVRLIESTMGKIPKPLVKIDGKELLRYNMENMDPLIVNKLVISLAHQRNQIKTWVKNANLLRPVEFSGQIKPGVTSAIETAISTQDSTRFVYSDGDALRINFNLRDAVKFHEASNSIATAIAAYTNNLYRHWILEINRNGLLTGIKIKDEAYLLKPTEIGLVHTGLHIIDRKAVDYFDSNFDKDWNGMIHPLVEAGKINVYVDPNMIFFNINTSQELHEAESYLKQKS